jgi:hypothetical protein
LDELARLALLLVFVGLGLRCLRSADGEARRRAVNVFLGYTLVASGFVAVTQRDAWPFTTYTLAAFRARADRPVCLDEFWGVDAAGREWRVDSYTWSPVFDSTLQTWFDYYYASLPEDGKRRALGFLLSRAEAGRGQLAAGRPIGYDRRLGPALSAPYWWLARRSTELAPTPYVGLRVYRVCRVPERLRRDPASRTRTLLSEYRER